MRPFLPAFLATSFALVVVLLLNSHPDALYPWFRKMVRWKTCK